MLATQSTLSPLSYKQYSTQQHSKLCQKADALAEPDNDILRFLL